MPTFRTGSGYVAIVLFLLTACAQAGSTPTPSPAPSSSQALAPPILTEPQAIETASQKAALSRIGFTGLSNIRNQQARLMTMGEYWASGQYDEGFLGSAKWYPESNLPVWVVLMEGNSESPLPTSSSLTPTRYIYFVVVLSNYLKMADAWFPPPNPKGILLLGGTSPPDSSGPDPDVSGLWTPPKGF